MTSGWAARPPEAIRSYNQAMEAHNQGRAQDALRFFNQAVSLDPTYSDAYYNMGSIHYQLKQYPQARDMFQRSVSINPADSQAKYNLALALEKMQRYDEAVGVLQQIFPNDKQYSQARAKIDTLRAAQQQATSPAASTVTSGTPAIAQTPVVQPTTASKPVVQTFSQGHDGPTGLAIGPGGFMYVANYSKNAIYRVGANGDKAIFAQGEHIRGPIGLVYNPRSNELYVANYLLNNIVRVDSQGKTSVLASGVGKPYNLFLDTLNSTLYITEQEGNIISRVGLSQ